MSAGYLARQPETATATVIVAAAIDKAPSSGGGEIRRCDGSKDAATVWLFATEEEQDAFQTERRCFRPTAEDFPVLTLAESAEAEREWQEGDTTFVEVRLTDSHRNEYPRDDGFLA